MDGSALRRLRGGAVGQLASVLTTIGVQLAQVPIYLAAVGTESYGAYLTIIAVPTLLSLSDLGLALASSTAMLRLISTGDELGARAVSRYAASGQLLLGTTTAIAIVPLGLAFPHDGPGISPTEGALIFLGYAGYSYLLMAGGLLEAAARAAGDHARTWVMLAVMRACDFAAGAIAVLSTGSLALGVLGMLASRLIGVVVLRRRVRRKAAWASFRPSFPLDRELLRTLTRPMLATFFQPLAFNSIMQGSILIVGAQLGPVAVVALAATRTLVNAVRQLANVFVYAGLPGMTSDLARGDLRAVPTLWRTVAFTVLTGTLLAGAGIIVFGPAILSWWTSGEIVESPLVIAVFVGQLMLDIAWLLLSMPLLARNVHWGYSVVNVVGTVVFLAVLAVLPLSTIAQVPLLQSVLSIAILISVLVTLRRYPISARRDDA